MAFRTEVIEQLRQRMDQLQGTTPSTERVSTGIAALDALLPHGGWRPGTLVEWLAEGAGSGAGVLALLSASPFLQRGFSSQGEPGALATGATHSEPRVSPVANAPGSPNERAAFVVVDETRTVYPPVFAGLGIPLEDTIIIRPQKALDKCWALEQSLRCPGVALTFAAEGRGQKPFSSASLRRLQLAAETGGGLGILLRPALVREQPSWAHLRLLVRAAPSASSQSSRRYLQVELLHARGGKSDGIIDLELNDETGHVRVVSPLADPALAAGEAGSATAAAGVIRPGRTGRLPGARLFAPSRRPGHQTDHAARGGASAG